MRGVYVARKHGAGPLTRSKPLVPPGVRPKKKMSDSPPAPDLSPGDDLDVMLEQLDTATDEILAKIENGRIRSPEHEKTRIQYYRALGYLLRTKRKILEDKTLEELAERIEEIEARREREKYR